MIDEVSLEQTLLSPTSTLADFQAMDALTRTVHFKGYQRGESTRTRRERDPKSKDKISDNYLDKLDA